MKSYFRTVLPAALSLFFMGCNLDDNEVKGSFASITACSEGYNNAACTTSGAGYYTSSLASNSNGIGSDGALSFSIADGYYIGLTCTAADTNLTADKIALETNVFGISGLLPEVTSNMHRTPGSAQMVLGTESVTHAGSGGTPDVPSQYHPVPTIATDGDGGDAADVTFVQRGAWGGTTCGTSQATIEARIQDCFTTIGATATWDGTTNGNAGQGTWKLVSRGGPLAGGLGREVWKDMRTGLLWSSKISANVGWCRATGSNFITNNPYAEDDPQDRCDNASLQNTGTGPATKAVSACYEDDGTYFTNVHGTIDNAGKVGLGFNSTPSVRWRLPTIYDYKMADINGIRFVLPDSNTDHEWTSTIWSGDRNYAQTVDGSDGTFAWQNRNGDRPARCVGR